MKAQGQDRSLCSSYSKKLSFQVAKISHCSVGSSDSHENCSLIGSHLVWRLSCFLLSRLAPPPTSTVGQATVPNKSHVPSSRLQAGVPLAIPIWSKSRYPKTSLDGDHFSPHHVPNKAHPHPFSRGTLLSQQAHQSERK